MGAIHPLRAFRERQYPRLTQVQLARLLGVSRVTVARWETGVRRVGEEKVLSIVKKTGIPPVELRPDLAALMHGGHRMTIRREPKT